MPVTGSQWLEKRTGAQVSCNSLILLRSWQVHQRAEHLPVYPPPAGIPLAIWARSGNTEPLLLVGLCGVCASSASGGLPISHFKFPGVPLVLLLLL